MQRPSRNAVTGFVVMGVTLAVILGLFLAFVAGMRHGVSKVPF
ncbi:hypothetical protein EDD99_5665 [Streptomyces sp. 846.5]|nr:hypothetical protein [Streptomyces sp. 846.5]TDT97519.1 hypothetical protein EDD99_5665 [Streptomyces sp. 846.5]